MVAERWVVRACGKGGTEMDTREVKVIIKRPLITRLMQHIT